MLNGGTFCSVRAFVSGLRFVGSKPRKGQKAEKIVVVGRGHFAGRFLLTHSSSVRVGNFEKSGDWGDVEMKVRVA